MKKLLSALAIAAASTALAVESSNTFGILRVTIPAHQQNTVIAAPWCDAGATTTEAQGKIKVKDIVKTANLTPATTNPAKAGDRIYVFDSNAYSAAFELQTVEGVVQWVGIQIAQDNAPAIAAPSADLTIKRGQAIGLVLAEAPASAKDIYLYGQFTTVSASTTITPGTSEVPAYTLVAPTGTGDDVVLNAAWLQKQTDLTPANGDMAFIPGKGYAPYVNTTSNSGFGAISEKFEDGTFKTVFTPLAVPAGTGFWYISKGGSGTITL